MELSILASGSSGNSFYVEENNEAILVDLGISTKQILERVEAIGKSINQVKAIFITHEHTDHVKGLEVFSRKFNLPVYLTRGTLHGLKFPVSSPTKIIKDGSEIKLGNFIVKAFSKSHDANEPVSFTIKGNKNLSIITDVGFGCDNVINAIKQSDAIIMESNYDMDMLINGSYPYYLKQRILGELGHLSNCESALLLAKYASKKLKQVYLAHLSLNNNSPDQALKSFRKVLRTNTSIKPGVALSYREKPTEIFRL
jgi:phosphoribosyl 1,2-cyclic phosphodiesterase